jgi:hypothetical protein
MTRFRFRSRSTAPVWAAGALCSVIGGPGGEISADLPVTPGEILQLNTGVTTTLGQSGNASDIRRASTARPGGASSSSPGPG